jgi:hypothetical protein
VTKQTWRGSYNGVEAEVTIDFDKRTYEGRIGEPTAPSAASDYCPTCGGFLPAMSDDHIDRPDTSDTPNPFNGVLDEAKAQVDALVPPAQTESILDLPEAEQIALYTNAGNDSGDAMNKVIAAYEAQTESFEDTLEQYFKEFDGSSVPWEKARLWYKPQID